MNGRGAPRRDLPRVNFSDALQYLDEHINLEAIAGRIEGLSLDRMRALTGVLGDPQLNYPCVHVTGTNGKGSTTFMISALIYRSVPRAKANELMMTGDLITADEVLDLHIVNAVVPAPSFQAEVERWASQYERVRERKNAKQPASEQALWRMVHRVCKRAGIRELSPHQLGTGSQIVFCAKAIATLRLSSH